MLLTVQEAAARLGCSMSAVYLAVDQGRIPHQKVLGRIGLSLEDVDAYAARLGQPNGWVKRQREDMRPCVVTDQVSDE